MYSIMWRLKHLDEFFWEPIRKQLFKTRQLRTERDYFLRELKESEIMAADYKARYEHQYEMKRKAEDERDAVSTKQESRAPGVVSNWQPKWEVDVGAGCKVGITIDDSCFMVLVPDFIVKDGKFEPTGKWKPTPWIPKAAARRIGELSEAP